MHFLIPIFAALILYLILGKKIKQEREFNKKYPVYCFNQSFNTWNGKLDDIKYKCNRDDKGVVIFAVRHDDSIDNPEEDVFIVIRDDGKELGRIPRKETVRYKEWSKGNVCTGIGIIHYDETMNKLWADISVLDSEVSDEDSEKAFRQYIEWAEHQFGSTYIPDRYRDNNA